MADASTRRKIETLTTAYLPFRSELAPFRDLPVELGKSQLFGFLAIIPFMGPFGIAMGALNFFPELRFGLKGLLVVGAAFAVGIFLSFRSLRPLARGLIESQRKLDAARLGVAGLDETYIGVAYANGVWRSRNESSWDRGYLKVLPEGLYFRGWGPEFALPAELISSVRIGSFDVTGMPKCYRLMVDWTAPDGTLETITFEPRHAPFGPESIAEVEALADRIEPLVGTHPDQISANNLPFRSSALDLREVIRSTDFQSMDFVIAGLLTLPILLIVALLFGLLSLWIPILRGGSIVIVLPVWMISTGYILARRAKKRRLAKI